MGGVVASGGERSQACPVHEEENCIEALGRKPRLLGA